MPTYILKNILRDRLSQEFMIKKPKNKPCKIYMAQKINN